MSNIDKTVKEIKDLKIQGATAIAKASLKALGQEVKRSRYRSVWEARKNAEKLKNARPTEPLTVNCLNYVFDKVKTLGGLKNKIEEVLAIIEKAEGKIAGSGVKLIKNGMSVLTHCHSSLVVKIFRQAKKQGVNYEVFLTETRPFYQGRITAKELVKAGIKTTMIVDSAACFLISKEDEIPINLVLLGCDAVFPSGGVFNKTGSYGISSVAWQTKTPLFVVGSLLKTTTSSLQIEKRKAKEVWEKKPSGLKILNLAFDFVPPEFIKGIICEFEIIKPSQVKEKVRENYPWILR